MALFMDTRDPMVPSFKESALRSSAPPQPLEPKVTICTSTLLYPDTALQTAWRLRRSSNSSPKRLSHTRPIKRALTPPPVLHNTTIEQEAQIQSPLPISKSVTPAPVQPLAQSPVNTYPTPPTDSPVDNYLEKYHEPTRAFSKPLLSPPVSPELSAAEPIKVCISCKSSQSPCWRPSWSPSAGQLCNSCGLRYKKTGARCLSSLCGKIPSKGEWSTMNKNAARDANGNLQYSCLQCHSAVELRSS